VPGVTIQSVRMRTLSRDLDRAHHVFVEAFRDVPDNTPMPREQFKAMGMGFLFLSNPNMMQIATVGDQAVGFALSFPELNEAIACNDGSLGPAGLARLFAGRKKIRTRAAPPRRAGTRTGLSAALIVASMRDIVEPATTARILVTSATQDAQRRRTPGCRSTSATASRARGLNQLWSVQLFRREHRVPAPGRCRRSSPAYRTRPAPPSPVQSGAG
jgi:hypothetical protein